MVKNHIYEPLSVPVSDEALREVDRGNYDVLEIKINNKTMWLSMCGKKSLTNKMYKLDTFLWSYLPFLYKDCCEDCLHAETQWWKHVLKEY